ncbi:DEAD-box ATP-dependent RNA helicase 21 [Hordeum vulgare]|uniref:DEAD-box ATP-dependent RNA helicase 21 n=1 Tax=Hordeum vulgare subsp. vulgare TaxID=112509 RepID=A0A8I6WZM2_HORVV|nr:DEAD-box ATP-dependent RNA helicase 21-like [Hordeum vulgare subsp. vulgare]KAE8800968.1 DEAD-box ATP-dependent RNA helicase 21 [Hordeum vulgare]
MAERAREKELEAIREQYLGGSDGKKPKTVAKLRDRFRFDWASTDDTSRVDAANDQPAHGGLLLYGRGFLAGIDRREQKKAAAAALQKESGAGAAARYDAIDMRVDRHWTDKRAEEMTERDWRILREDFGISYRGSRVPRPMRSWAESGLGAELLRNVDRAGYRKPTPIQMAAVPLGLQRRDVIGVAQTGSGKTAAFVLPMLAYIAGMAPPTSHSEEGEGPYALILGPTRELAQKIERETVKLAAHLRIRVVSIVGGKADGQSTIQKQASMLEQGCEVIVATPGRLLDCLESRYAVLNRCSYVVLDEADRMIDMGFEPQVVGVLDAMPSSHLKPESADEELDEARTYRTTHMFSATMPPAVERLARKYLRNPVAVTVGSAGKAADLVAQNVVMVKVQEKMPRLTRILADLGKDRRTAIVFCNTKNSVEKLTNDLEYAGMCRVTALQGGKSQDERKASLEGFRNGRFNVLVATDLAARGIDVPEVAHVINYEMPSSIDLYTHRIGRTGRAGKKGLSTSFLTMEDTDIFYDLKQMLVQSNCPVPPELARHEAYVQVQSRVCSW